MNPYVLYAYKIENNISLNVYKWSVNVQAYFNIDIMPETA